jgi:hypothetical protein
MDFLAWVSFNLLVLTGAKVEWIVNLVLWSNSITIDTLEDIYNGIYDDFLDEYTDEDDEEDDY